MYSFQQSALLLSRLSEDREVEIISTSVGEENLTCSTTLILKAIDSPTGIYPTGLIPQTMRLTVPVILEYSVEEIIAGSQLSFQFT